VTRCRLPASALLAPILLSVLSVLAPEAAWAEDEPFDVVPLDVKGRPVQAWVLPISSGCGEHAKDVLVISVQGAPPNEKRRVTLFPCDPSGRPNPGQPISIEVGPEVVAVDSYEVDGKPDAELLLLDRKGIEIISPWGHAPPRRIEVAGGLPLPPRARGLSRMNVAGNWNGDGRPTAVLPSLDGGVMVDLLDGSSRLIELPLIAQYRTFDPDLPGRVRQLMIAELQWPVIVTGDDDGDGVQDLFALSRWDLWVYRGGPDGLPASPTRRIEIQPFNEEEEMRFEATEITYFAEDLNGDGRTDFLLHRISGGLMAGKAVADVYFNPGDGADASGPPSAQVIVKNGFSGVQPFDLDADGQVEVAETSIQFGIVQLVRILLTRKANVSLRVLNSDPANPSELVSSWQHDMTFKVNFGEGRAEGLFPNMEGDWNGDGRNDLIHPAGDRRIAVRLGRPGAKGPEFGDQAGTQKLPIDTGRTRVADLNGDGLDDLVVYDPREIDGKVWALYNAGRLPGTRPGLSAD
jgi:hypothetical protein